MAWAAGSAGAVFGRLREVDFVPDGHLATVCVAGATLLAADLTPAPAISYGAGLALATGTVLHAVTTARSRRRAQLLEAITGGIAPVAGAGARVSARQWGSGWDAIPGVLVVTHDPHVQTEAPEWSMRLLAAVRQRTAQQWAIASHDHRRRRVTLVHQELTGPGLNAVEERVGRTVHDLLGATATVDELELNAEGEPERFCVTHRAATKLASPGYRRRVERTVSTVLPGRWRARWDMEADRAVFELRPTLPRMVDVQPADVTALEDPLATYRQVAIPLGLDEDGEVLTWQPAIDPNLMVVGAPGTGKTRLEHVVLGQVARFGWPIWVVDGKSVEFLGFRTWPNVQIVGTHIWQQIAIIERAHALMEHRYTLITEGRARETDFEPLMLFMDEYADFRANVTAWYTQVKQRGEPTKPPVFEKLASIARKGRTARVHLLFATQRPDAEYFGSGDMRDNFRFRISTGRLSPQGAMMMWQDPSVGTSVPRIPGRATAINENNVPVEIQTFWFPDPRTVSPDDEHNLALLEAMRPTVETHPPLVLEEPQETPVLNEDGEVVGKTPPSYDSFAGTPWFRLRDRPDLDPVAATTPSPADARRLASPTALLNLDPDDVDPAPETSNYEDYPHREQPPSPPSTGRPALRVVAPPADDDEEDTASGLYDGYGPVLEVVPEEVTIGDLLLVEPDTGCWAVVDDEPGEDPSDPEAIAICWRSDDDESGLLCVSDGELVTIRRPHDE